MSEPANSPIVQYRPLHMVTSLSGHQVMIAAPAEESGQHAATQLLDQLSQLNVNAHIQIDPPDTVLTTAKSPVFVIGNLANSQCVKHLYYQYLCVTDRWYPGPSGYEVRTLLDPFGTGSNIIHLGYSNDDGLTAGLQVLLGSLSNPLPFYQKVHATRLPLSAREVERITESSLQVPAWRIFSGPLIDQKGYLGYLSGNNDLLAEYAAAWPKVIACGVERTPLICPHLYMLSRVVVWRLLEQTGYVPAELSLHIVQFLHNWAESAEGIQHIKHPVYQSPHYPRQNHGTIPALGMILTADFFSRHFPHVPNIATWREAAQAVFAPYTSSWKPLCDGLCHGWWMSQPVLLEYGLFDPTHTYFTAGGARTAAECALAVVNNEGWMPSAGDADLVRQFPGPSVRIAAAYYNEPRYRAVYDQVSDAVRFKWLGATPPPRAFDIGLPTVPPAEKGLRVVPMDPLVYEVWEKEPRLARGAADTQPQDPLEDCFDKLAIRGGQKPGDDYLLIDGLGGGSHSYADAGAVLEYTHHGVAALVSEDSLIWTAPEDHSSVVITRDGEMGVVPAFPAIEAKEETPDGDTYVAFRLRDFAGADWVREVFFLPGQGVVFHDAVLAGKAGLYAAEANFRTPAPVQVDGFIARSVRQSPFWGSVEVSIQSLVPHGMESECVPVSVRYEHPAEPDIVASDAMASWCERYHTEEAALHIVRSRLTGNLQPGESLSFTHLVQVRKEAEPALRLERHGSTIVVTDGVTRKELRCRYVGSEQSAAGAGVGTGGGAGVRQQGTVACAGAGAGAGVDGGLHRDVACAGAVVGQLQPPVRMAACSAHITGLATVSEQQVVAGAADGSVMLVAGDCVRWQRQVAGEVYDIAVVPVADPFVVVAHAPAALTAFSLDGTLRWQRPIEREPSPYPWWELPEPTPVQVVASAGNGKPWLAAGCGDMQVRGFDVNGEQTWLWRYNEGVPGRMRVADVDGDGADEIIVGGEILSDTSACRILTGDGVQKANLIVEGWTSLLTSVSWTEMGGRRLVACGGSRGRNLRLYDITLITSGGAPISLIEARYGGKVTGVCFLPELGLLAVGSSQGFVRGLTATGECRWQLLLDRAVTWMGVWNGKLVVHERGGRVNLINGEGCVTSSLDAGLPWRCAQLVGQQLWFASGDGVYRLDPTMVG